MEIPSLAIAQTEIIVLTPRHPTLLQTRSTHLVQVHKVRQVGPLERLEVIDGRADAVENRGWRVCAHACMYVCVCACKCARVYVKME